MKKLLIAGASGFLGWNLCQEAKSEWAVWGTYWVHPVQIPGVRLLPVDLREEQEIAAMFALVQPDAVILTAAASQPNFCQERPQESHAINVQAACHIAQMCAQERIQCVFTSTDLVFNGLHPPYRETDAVCPVSIYGEQKVMAELEMLDRYPQTAVCRMPLMFGDGGPASKSFVQPMLQTLKQGTDLALFTDEFRTPVSATTAAQGLLLALQINYQGILHLGGRESVSRYEFFRLLLQVLFGEHPSPLPGKIKQIRQQDVKMAAPRPPDVSLNSGLAFALGYNPPPLRAEFEALREVFLKDIGWDI